MSATTSSRTEGRSFMRTNLTARRPTCLGRFGRLEPSTETRPHCVKEEVPPDGAGSRTAHDCPVAPDHAQTVRRSIVVKRHSQDFVVGGPTRAVRRVSHRSPTGRDWWCCRRQTDNCGTYSRSVTPSSYRLTRHAAPFSVTTNGTVTRPEARAAPSNARNTSPCVHSTHGAH